ncbi:MAG: solute carrier family 23 protein [Candidatus Binatia bacterium]
MVRRLLGTLRGHDRPPVIGAGASLRREVIGGLTTFLTMTCIVIVNPAVLSQAGMDFGAVMTATCIAAAVATAVIGLAANYPIAMAPAMGENFFFLTVAVAMGHGWRIALGFIAHPLVKLLAGRGREAAPVASVLAVLFVLRYALL